MIRHWRRRCALTCVGVGAQEGACLAPVGAIAAHEPVEVLVVAGLEQMAELVDDHGLQAGGLAVGQLEVDGDVARAYVAGAPAARHATYARARVTHAHRALVSAEELFEPVGEHAFGQRVDGGADVVCARVPFGQPHLQRIPVQTRKALWCHLNREDIRDSEQGYATAALPARPLVQGTAPRLTETLVDPIRALHHHALKVSYAHAHRGADAERSVRPHAHVDAPHATTMERDLVGTHADHALAPRPITCDH